MIDCTLWGGSLDKDGYGTQYVKGVVVKAHRYAYCIAHNITLESIKSKVVLHTCDTPSCVEPNHLVLGSQLDNIADRHAKGRCHKPKGELHPNHDLTVEDVRYIRQVYVPKHLLYGCTALAQKFHVQKAAISKVIHRRTWQHI